MPFLRDFCRYSIQMGYQASFFIHLFFGNESVFAIIFRSCFAFSSQMV